MFLLVHCSGWGRRNPWIPRANVPPFFTICYCIVLLVFAGLCETCGFSSLFLKMASALFCTKIEAQRICCTTSRLDELKNRQNYRVFVGYISMIA